MWSHSSLPLPFRMKLRVLHFGYDHIHPFCDIFGFAGTDRKYIQSFGSGDFSAITSCIFLQL
jgi:hypothetical protein